MANVLRPRRSKTSRVKEYPLKTAHSGPHGLVEDKDGNIGTTGNTGALIGKLDPKTGAVTEYPMPDPQAKDPHTLIFEKAGILWFTVQNANRIGRLDPTSGEIKLLTAAHAEIAPYGMALDSKGNFVRRPVRHQTRWRESIRRRWKSASTPCRIRLPVRAALPSPATT